MKVSRNSLDFLEGLFTKQERMALAFLVGLGSLGVGIQAWQKLRSVGAAFVPAAEPVAVNRSGAAELTALPGIGPALARRIVEDREGHGFFLVPEDLRRVKGVSTKVLEKLKGLVRFD